MLRYAKLGCRRENARRRALRDFRRRLSLMWAYCKLISSTSNVITPLVAAAAAAAVTR